MPKPSVTLRLVKGSELTFQEGDDNFANLRDATITVNGDTGSIVNDLNGSFTVAGGTGLTTSVASSTLTVNLDNTAVTAGSYTNANVTIDAQGRITSASNGSAGFTQSDARTAISVTDSGGEGSLSYDNTTGVITYSGPSFSGLEVTSNKNTANGYAGLDANGKISSTLLPSYVDDVLEYASLATFPGTGETGVIYVDTGANKTYRWTGSTYVEISQSASYNLNDLTDVDTTGKMNGHILRYNSTSSQWESQLLSSVSTLDDLTDVVISTPSTNQFLRYNGAQSRWENQTATFLSAVGEDANPTLGGDLNVSTRSIVSTANGNITLAPNGTGKVVLSGNAFPNGLGTNGQVLTTNGSGTLSWATPSSGGNPVVIVQWGNAVEISGGAQRQVPTELYDPAGIFSVSSTYNFTLPAGTYVMYFATKIVSKQSNWAGGSYDWVSVSGNSTFTPFTFAGLSSTGGAIQLTNAGEKFTLTQTSTFYMKPPDATAFYNSSNVPTVVTIEKIA